MVGNTLKISEKVTQHKSELNCTFTLLKALDVTCLKHILKVVNNLLKRLNKLCLFIVVFARKRTVFSVIWSD